MARKTSNSGVSGPAGCADERRVAELEERIRKVEQERDAVLERLGQAEQTKWMLDALMDHLPEGIAFAETPNVQIRLVSRYGLEMSGRSFGEISRIDPSDAADLGTLHPDGTRARYEELPLVRATLAGEVVRNEEWLLRRPDGREITVLCNAGPVRDAQGRITGGIVAWRDIDQLRLTRRTLRTVSEYKLALDSARLGTWDYNVLSRRFSLGERCRTLFGAMERELSYERFLALFDPEDRLRLKEEIERAAFTGDDGHFSLEVRVRNPDGKYRWLLVNAQALFARAAEGRKSVRLIGCVMDITERKKMEQDLRGALEELRAANRAKDEFVAVVSHELRTPLTIIMASLQLLQKDDVPQRDYLLNEAESAADHLLAIIEDLLDFSLLERRKLEIGRRPFDLRACVQKALGAVIGRAREKSLPLNVEIAPQVPQSILGDSARLGQVLFNLTDNAVKFTEAGEVALRIELVEESLVFSVRDTGIGIPEEKLHMVFDGFAQADASSTRRYGGTGLGLAISKGLVELMGGKIRVESREGVGSTFIFSLPLASALPGCGCKD